MTLSYENHSLKKKFIETFHKCYGNITLTSRNVGIDRSTYYDWYKDDPVFRKHADDAQEITIDFVENSLMKSIGEGDTTAAIFWLKQRAKSRGYSEQVNLKHSGDKEAPVEHQHNFDITKYDKETIDALMRIKREG